MPAWLALLDGPAGDLSASAVSSSAGSSSAGSQDRQWSLAAWCDSARRPHPQARRLDARVLDPLGAAAEVSLLWPALGALPLFDEPAVVRARRTARSLRRPRCATTFPVESRHFAGSLWSPGPAGRLDEDPFRLLGVPLRLHVGAGLLGAGPALVGPAQERYAGAPWPAGAL